MSTATKLFLVRHARPIIDPHVPVAEWQLDPQGGTELERLASLPSLASAVRIVASTEPKALHTAEAIRATVGLPEVQSYADLGEVYKAGFVQDHDATMARLFAEPDRSVLPGWESAAAALNRFRSCLNERLAETDGDLIVIAHGTVISLYLADLLGQERVDLAAWAAISFPDLTVVDPTGRRVLQPFGAWRV